MKNLSLFNSSNKSALSYVSSFRFTTNQNKCKNNPDKTCENKGGCHSKQHSHNHEHHHHHHHHHENGCCNHETKASTLSSSAYNEDPDIAKLKDLLNSFAKDGNHTHNHEHGCCGGHHHDHSHEQNVANKQEHGCCGGKHNHHHHHHHEHEHQEQQNLQSKQEHECCGGHHHHHHDHDHQMKNHSHENNVQNNNHHHNLEADHHHHHHDGCCGHDHDHDHHHHHHEHNAQPIDLEALAKQKITEEEFVLNSGEQVKAVYSGDNTVSYSISDNVKGVKARDPDHGQLVMIFTCTVCETRSSRSFTKKAYNEGIVLIRCETCDSLHLVADNLGWFNDHKSNVETIMEEKGEKVHKIDTSEQINDILSQFINRETNDSTKNNQNS